MAALPVEIVQNIDCILTGNEGWGEIFIIFLQYAQWVVATNSTEQVNAIQGIGMSDTFYYWYFTFVYMVLLIPGWWESIYDDAEFFI